MTDNGTTTQYCYDANDKMTWSSDTSIATPTYDAHGSTTAIGSQTMTYDGADRHTTTTTGSTTINYLRDVTNRIKERNVNGANNSWFQYCNNSDSPCGVVANNYTYEKFVSVLGGVNITIGHSGGDVWSYPNVHGDVMMTATATGSKTGATNTYEPFGKNITTLPDNATENFDYGWEGQKYRATEHEGSLNIIEMGARQCCAIAYFDMNWAEQQTAARYHTQDSREANAFRHLLYSAMLTWHLGFSYAKKLLDLHESVSKDPIDSRIDSLNNTLGQGIGSTNYSTVWVARREILRRATELMDWHVAYV